MVAFKRQNSIFVPSNLGDGLEKKVSSTHRKALIVDGHGNPIYLNRDGKFVSKEKVAELAAYREGLGIKLEGGTLLDFLINNKTVEYISDSGRKETADLKDAALKKRFVETIAAVKDALKGNADYYDAETDALKLSSEQLKGILGVVDEYAVDHYTADVNVRKHASLRIAQKITARPASVDDKIVQLPAYDGSTGSNGAGWAAVAAAGLLLALATGCSLTYDPYARTRRRQKRRTEYKKTEWGSYEQPLRAGIGFVHNGNTSKVTSATGNQTWNTPSNGLELYVDGSAAEWKDFDYNTSNYRHIIIPVVFDYRCLWLSNSGSIEGASGSLGDIKEGSEQWFRLMSGFEYGISEDLKHILFKGLIGVETMKDDVSFTYDINDIDIVLDAGGFAWYLGVDGKLNDSLVLGIGYGQTGMNGNQTTDVSSGGIPLSSENLDVNGTRRRFDFRAVINPFDVYGDEWYGPTQIIFRRTHDDLSVFDRTSNEFEVRQDFNLGPKAALYFGAAYNWGTKDSTDASEDRSGYRIMLGVDLSGLINGRSND